MSSHHHHSRWPRAVVVGVVCLAVWFGGAAFVMSRARQRTAMAMQEIGSGWNLARFEGLTARGRAFTWLLQEAREGHASRLSRN
jgi:hypothetical protein